MRIGLSESDATTFAKDGALRLRRGTGRMSGKARAAA
jgi:hypothetical protein